MAQLCDDCGALAPTLLMRQRRPDLQTPLLHDVYDFLDQLDTMIDKVQPWNIAAKDAWWVWAPVLALRWTHSGVDSRAVFRHDKMEGRSIYQTLDELFRGITQPHDITPLEVVIDNHKLFSLSNRRLMALKMYQGIRGDEVIWVRCVLLDSNHAKYDRSKSTLNDGCSIKPNLYHGARNVPEHFGVPMFRPTLVAEQKIQMLEMLFGSLYERQAMPRGPPRGPPGHKPSTISFNCCRICSRLLDCWAPMIVGPGGDAAFLGIPHHPAEPTPPPPLVTPPPPPQYNPSASAYTQPWDTHSAEPTPPPPPDTPCPTCCWRMNHMCPIESIEILRVMYGTWAVQNVINNSKISEEKLLALIQLNPPLCFHKMGFNKGIAAPSEIRKVREIHQNIVVWNTLVSDLQQNVDVTSTSMAGRCANPSCYYAAHPVFSEYFGYCCNKCCIWGHRGYLLEDDKHGKHCRRCENY